MREILGLFLLLTKLFFIYIILLTFLISFAMLVAEHNNGELNEKANGFTEVCVRDLCT
jgi:hypothetical protein